MNTPPKRTRGAELSVGRRTAMAVEVALAIPPGKTRVSKGILGPQADRYGVGPDLNVNDLGFFASLKSRVWGMNASPIDELVETIFQQYEEYDSATLERVWQSLFKVYNQTLRKMGDNDFSVEHTGVTARQKAGTLRGW